mgnify:CR=1 FL=1
MREIIIGILTGIVSGIISSIIVTQGYRLKDRERDRIQYIERFRQFYTQLDTFVHNSLMCVSFAEFRKIKAPKKYKWTHITAEDKKTIDKVMVLQREVLDILVDMEFESENMNDELEKIKLTEKYVPEFDEIRDKIDELHDEIYLLEYPENKDIIKILRMNESK